MKRWMTALGAAAVILSPGTSRGDVPELINYQGVLTDAAGVPLDGPYALRFAVYQDSSVATMLWSELHPVVDVDEGIFNVILGSLTPIPAPLFSESERWLGVRVGVSGPEIQPRSRLTSSPYAHRAAFADSAAVAVGGADGDWIIEGTGMYAGVTGNVGIGTDTPDTKLHVEGEVTVDVLHVTGADLAERFPVRGDAIPGMVLSIDPDHPGALRPCRGAYDRGVAGVVSGANDLPTGAILGNLEGPEGEGAPVALSGRVWALCDARQIPIEPGDLLTTSRTEGHAMAVVDRDQAQGAVLGKAMTRLAGGRGLVLVLVTLQ
jgi:hypothetical protein